MFLRCFLSNSSVSSTLPSRWSGPEQQLVNEIKDTRKGQEKHLYTGSTPPLLRLLNHISKQVFEDLYGPPIQSNKNTQKALIFHNGSRCTLKNPFVTQDRCPDIVAVWEGASTFQEIDYSEDKLTQTTWCELAAVGEAKVAQHGKFQLASYLQNHLQLHPELNAVLGFTAQSTGYAIFYHDAAGIHRSEYDWKPGPLYQFIRKLYTRPFQDVSMRLLDPKHAAWATKVGNDVYLSESAQAQAGPGQRRYTTAAVNRVSDEMVFIKDIWRDEGKLFFEALLFDQAHKGNLLSGLMSVHSHGYVLDEKGEPVRTIRLGSELIKGWSSTRYKMRMVTKDIGHPLKGLCSLRRFLCVMYDSCVVQRNLYRKCRILHRDISDGNIMFAPETDEYKERCAQGYAEVKFANQVLAKKNVEPKPECLVIDLGHGADLKVKRNEDGTPKFIARSIAAGRLLNKVEYKSNDVRMPQMEGPLSAYRQFMHTTQYHFDDSSASATPSDPKLAHQLFHDAESTFWVIVWLLTRSAGEGSDKEPEPHLLYKKFFHIMHKHHPSPGDDSRNGLCERGVEYWESLLHQDLVTMAPMLDMMHEYVRPDWAYRPELNPEHVHEALMRLLLAEIVRIDETDSDITIALGGRPIPPAPRDMPPLSSSTVPSLAKSASRSRTSNSVDTQLDSPSETKSVGTKNSNSRSNSRSVEPETLGINRRLQKLALDTDSAPASDSKESNPRAWLREIAKSLKWKEGIHELRHPKYDANEDLVLNHTRLETQLQTQPGN